MTSPEHQLDMTVSDSSMPLRIYTVKKGVDTEAEYDDRQSYVDEFVRLIESSSATEVQSLPEVPAGPHWL